MVFLFSEPYAFLLTGTSVKVLAFYKRLYSMLKGKEFDTEQDEISLADLTTDQIKEVTYNQNIPIETFDFIITDECHRSIEGLNLPA